MSEKDAHLCQATLCDGVEIKATRGGPCANTAQGENSCVSKIHEEIIPSGEAEDNIGREWRRRSLYDGLEMQSKVSVGVSSQT